MSYVRPTINPVLVPDTKPMGEELPLETVIDWLDRSVAKASYRRFGPLAAGVVNSIDAFPDAPEIAVISGVSGSPGVIAEFDATENSLVPAEFVALTWNV